MIPFWSDYILLGPVIPFWVPDYALTLLDPIIPFSALLYHFRPYDTILGTFYAICHREDARFAIVGGRLPATFFFCAWLARAEKEDVGGRGGRRGNN